MNKKILVSLFMMLLCTMAIGMSSFAADTTLKSKKWASGGASYVDTNNDGVADTIRDSGVSYYKITIPKTGYIKVQVNLSDAPGAYEYYKEKEDDSEEAFPQEHVWLETSTKVGVLDAKKKAIHSQNEFWITKKESNYTFTEAVKKGNYYLAVSSNQKYKIRYTFTAVGKLSKNASKPSKAPALKAGQTVKNLLYPGKEQFYKINLSTKRKLILLINSKFDEMDIILYKKKGKKLVQVDEKGSVLSGANIWNSWFSCNMGGNKITVNWPKGTYYIRVLSFSDRSGYYTLKWN